MKNYCADLQGGLWLQYNTKKAAWFGKPCCLYQTKFPIHENINSEYWQHPTIIAQRQDNIAGKELPDECGACKQTELLGNYSRRESWNERLGTEWQQPASVIELDVQCDFSCNLACSICGPQYSTLWRQIDTTYKINNNKFKVRATNSNVLDLIETMPLHDIKQIHFQGGEPLLSNTHIQLLEKLEKTVDLSKIVLWYHSNGTQRVSETVLKFWEKFKMVEIYFSLDDMGPRMEYQRWPINWTEVHENMLWWKENLSHNTMLRIERTVGVLSAYWVDELEQWHQQYFSHSKYRDTITMNYHNCDGVYSCNAMSELYRQALLEKFPANHWIHNNVKNLKSDSVVDIKLMFADLNHYDQVKFQNWKNIYPEFLKWYPEYAN
tara:strand:+ start:178 stop:1314 length:1137 start_codon:yes stop_codon:yes gene_type:complete